MEDLLSKVGVSLIEPFHQRDLQLLFSILLGGENCRRKLEMVPSQDQLGSLLTNQNIRSENIDQSELTL